MNIFEKKIITVVILGSEQIIKDNSKTNFKITFSRFSKEEITAVKKLYELHCQNTSPTDSEKQQQWSQIINSSIVDLPLNSYINYIKTHMSEHLDKDVSVSMSLNVSKKSNKIN